MTLEAQCPVCGSSFGIGAACYNRFSFVPTEPDGEIEIDSCTLNGSYQCPQCNFALMVRIPLAPDFDRLTVDIVRGEAE